MNCLIKNGRVFVNGRFVFSDILINNGTIAAVSNKLTADNGFSVYNAEGCIIIPGLIDVHVHLREPGFSYKETIHTGTEAAAHGGYTSVCSMPNLNPVPDSLKNLKVQLDIIKNDAVISVYPYGSITVGEKGEILSDFSELSEYVCAFSDDGKGVQNENMMRSAMVKAKELNKIIAAHCEVNELLNGGYIHDGEYCKKHNHRGICSESEWAQIKRDIAIASETGSSYHVCHISTKESVDIIRKAKADGVDITCETGPHYLTLTDSDLQENGRFKMNPPLRSEEDRLALIEGIKDGTIDMIATDHAPHSAEEKSKGLEGSAMGVTGLECAFPIVYTNLVKTSIITLEKALELMHTNPSKRFGIGHEIVVGLPADFTVFNLDDEFTINPCEFFSKGHATPFEGASVCGKCLMTVCNGKIVYKEADFEAD